MKEWKSRVVLVLQFRMLIPGWVVPTLASLGFSRYLFLASVVNQLFPFQHTLWRAIIVNF